MIGYYVHHQGRGHLHRAQAVAAALDETVTGLSSLERPAAWRGPWVDLPRDDESVHPREVTAGGQLHWAPQDDDGLRARSATFSAWIERARPRLVVADVSVEIALLCRLHGVPVVSIVMPGRRTDAAHLLGYRVSSLLVAVWPAAAVGMAPGLPSDVADRIHCVGAVSRSPVCVGGLRRPGPSRVTLLQGRGGGELTSMTGTELDDLAPGWEWTRLGGTAAWVDDPVGVLRGSDVIVTNAGQGSLADVAAVRRPAIVIPAERPHDEQATTATVLEDERWPALVLSSFPQQGWDHLLGRASALDGTGWEAWCDGQAASRFAGLLAPARFDALRSA